MKSILLIGLGNFGKLVAKQITQMGHEVLVVDKNEDRINEVMSYVTDAIIGDSTKEDFLKTLGINNYDVCIVAIGDDFQSSLETTSLLKELGGTKVVALANREVQEKFLLRNGADGVINPERQIAKWTAIRYTSDYILDYIKLDDDHAIFEVAVPREWIGKSVGGVDIRKKYNVNILAVKTGQKLDSFITPDTLLCEGKSLMVMGKFKDIQKCFHI